MGSVSRWSLMNIVCPNQIKNEYKAADWKELIKVAQKALSQYIP